jgi:hypothetical protein
VAVIAADDLTPAASSHVAQILHVPDKTNSVEKAIAVASIRPDNGFARKIGRRQRGITSTSAPTTAKRMYRLGARKEIASPPKSMTTPVAFATAI